MRASGPQASRARPHLRDPGSQHPDHRPRPADRRSRLGAASRDDEKKLPRVRRPLFDLAARDQGIVHIIGPELGLTQPGMTIVCGDSHTATHGAFGALAFGIGTSEVEHVLATQCLWQVKPRTLSIGIDGKLLRGRDRQGHDPRDHRQHRHRWRHRSVVEYRGSAVEALSIEERMTVCNMSIEAGARAGMVAADQKTIDYLRGRKYVPKGAEFDRGRRDGWSFKSDEGAKFDRASRIDAAEIAPQVTWGTNPGHGGRGYRQSSGSSASICRTLAQVGGGGAGIYGAQAGHHDQRHQDRSRVHRIVHQFAAERSASRGEDLKGRKVASQRPRDGGAGLAARQAGSRRSSASTKFSPTPDSNGASQDAACAWA